MPESTTITLSSDAAKRMAALRQGQGHRKPIRACTDYIDAHLHMPIRVDALARHAGLSPAYLSTLFKRETGVSLGDYILRRRIDTACNMLRYSDYPAAQISEILAFSSQSYFIRCFKRQTGVTPREFRQIRAGHALNAASGSAKSSPAP